MPNNRWTSGERRRGHASNACTHSRPVWLPNPQVSFQLGILSLERLIVDHVLPVGTGQFLDLVHEVLRSNDLVARIGGVEFVIIVGGTRGKEAPNLQEISERLIGAVHIGCSIGIASAMKSGESVQDMLDRAGATLYKAKAEGRNCAVAA